jgi:hypothetical protein
MYPKQPWPQYDYRSCMTDRNLTTLNCSQPDSSREDSELLTMYLHFLGRNTAQNWRCQRENESLVCRN